MHAFLQTSMNVMNPMEAVEITASTLRDLTRVLVAQDSLSKQITVVLVCKMQCNSWDWPLVEVNVCFYVFLLFLSLKHIFFCL